MLTAAAALVAATSLAASPLPRDKVPEPLKPWVEWVLRGHEDELCPFANGQAEARFCAWPSRLELTLDGKGGRFRQEWRIERKTWVPLPGEVKRWPQEVRVDGAPAVVAPLGDEPNVLLEAGDHRVEGSFAWDAAPDSVKIPAGTGLLALTVLGKPVAYPNRDPDGRLWLQKQAGEAQAANRMTVTVHRRVVDEIPLQVVTRIELQVAGKNREEVLGPALLAGATPLSLESGVPARIEPDGKLRVQVRPGTWRIDVTTRQAGPIRALTLGTASGAWAPEEVWVFEARPQYRLVTVEGVTSVDPQQTTLPDEWKALPAYRMKPGEAMRFDEKRRGDADPAPDRLVLRRNLWLDFDGAGYTVSDNLSGVLSRSWRLEMPAPVRLGRVSVGGRDQFITRLGASSPAGVEIREGTVSIAADSRLDGASAQVPAVGWDQDMSEVSGVLHLPPGWRLFSASGADDVPGTWIRGWTLLDLFLALIIALAVGRLWGVKWGVLAIAAMGLTFTERDAPQFVWLAVLAGEALVRVLPDNWVRKVLRVYRVGAWAVLALVALPFAVEQVRVGMYPSLEDRGRQSGGFDYSTATFESTPPPAAVAVDGKEGWKVDEPAAKQEQSRLPSFSGSVAYKAQRSVENLKEVDPNSMVQTGPGVPRWDWNQFELRWNGPVQRGQTLHLLLLPPKVNLALAFLRVLLLGLLVGCLVGFGGWGMRWLRLGGGASAAVLLLLALPGAARADVGPSKEILDDLRSRLLDRPGCVPNCASSPRLLLDVTQGAVQARMEISASEATAVPLPGAAQHWVPSQVLLDGNPAKGLLRMSDGFLWIELTPGTHQIQLEGALPDRDTVQIPLPFKPHRVEAHVAGWTLEGLHEDGLADDDLQLTRARSEHGGSLAALQQGTLPPFVQVERTLILGLRWEATTRVTRLSPKGSAVVLEVPLMPGESVTSADVRVEGDKALVNLAPQADEIAWTSVLEPSRQLKLVAPDAPSWTEVWQLNASPVLHVGLQGIPMVHAQDTRGSRVPEWRPWPGESLTIEVSHPEGVPGQTLTIDRAVLSHKPGIRSTDVVLELRVRASRGGQHALALPPGAELQSVLVNGASQPIRQEGEEVRLPIVPGAQEFRLTWREPRGTGLEFRTSRIDLGVPSTNVDLQVDMPRDRWILFAAGPRLGPAVLFWSLLIVLIGVALALSRTRLTPLTALHWVLLGLGLSQVPVVAAAIVAGWLLVIGWRRNAGARLGNKTFDGVQILIVGWTIAALIVLAVAIHQGLLGTPDMQIEGNGSGFGGLRWYQDRATGPLPLAWAVSVPLMIYRGAMLLWALWLAFAMLRWLRWAWESFIAGGGWRRFFKPRPPPGLAPVPLVPKSP